MNYKVKINSLGQRVIVFTKTNEHLSSFIDPSPGNSDWHEYQDWLAAGNTPEPPDPPPPPVDPGPSLQDRVEAAETLINLILSEGE